ncbi:hypothetical protein AU467_18795 [Mesorhizobium loti]|uniref:Uncharacterized protein n=1 Tax=Rhizobium loti TaxID=381 RepID=A0A101KU36_RHILI|nr:hypothetical protein AU467_18795 [Mesorhizobium loti]
MIEAKLGKLAWSHFHDHDIRLERKPSANLTTVFSFEIQHYGTLVAHQCIIGTKPNAKKRVVQHLLEIAWTGRHGRVGNVNYFRAKIAKNHCCKRAWRMLRKI